MRRLAISLFGLFVCVACLPTSPAGDPPSEPNVSHLHHVRNNQFELTVSADHGRIMFYGPIGGRNLLWTNPHPDIGKSPFNGWINWGGDKVWIWPEDDWAKWAGSDGPPPGDPVSGPFTIEATERTIRMISPVLPAYGVRIKREITLAPTGSCVTLVNTLEQVDTPRLALPVAPWTITQVPAPERIYARLTADATSPGFQRFPPNVWTPQTISGQVIVMKRPANPWVKMGLDADRLAVPFGDNTLFVISTSGHDGQPAYEPFRRAQVFSAPDLSDYRAKDVAPYVELEFTGPLNTLSRGQAVSMTTIWQLCAVKDGDFASAINAQ